MLVPKAAMASRGRILIVDDEANARAALNEILREDGFVTETAADGFSLEIPPLRERPTSKAAAVLGISSRKIQYKLHEYGNPAQRLLESDR